MGRQAGPLGQTFREHWKLRALIKAKGKGRNRERRVRGLFWHRGASHGCSSPWNTAHAESPRPWPLCAENKWDANRGLENQGEVIAFRCPVGHWKSIPRLSVLDGYRSVEMWDTQLRRKGCWFRPRDLSRPSCLGLWEVCQCNYLPRQPAVEFGPQCTHSLSKTKNYHFLIFCNKADTIIEIINIKYLKSILQRRNSLELLTYLKWNENLKKKNTDHQLLQEMKHFRNPRKPGGKSHPFPEDYKQ